MDAELKQHLDQMAAAIVAAMEQMESRIMAALKSREARPKTVAGESESKGSEPNADAARIEAGH